MPNVSLSGIEFTIKGNADSASDAINKLITNLNKLNSALSNMSGVKDLAKSMNRLKRAMEGLSKIDTKGFAKAMSALTKSMKSMSGITTMAKDMATFARNMNNLAKDPTKLGDVAIWLSRIASIDFMNLQEASQAIKNLADAYKMISGQSDDAAKKVEKSSKALGLLKSAGIGAAKGLGKLVAMPFKHAVSNVSAFSKSLGGVLRGFKRIIGYRIIRTIIKEITQGFQEGVKNLYEWSRLTGGAMGSRNKTFAQSLDQIATSMLYFKNSIGAAVAPIINALAPAIDFLVDKIVTLLNVLNQLFAKLTGATSWTRAKKKATEYGDAVSGAGQAAEEALRYLAPFDELNVLPDQKDKGSGGGGGGTDYSDMFEDVTEFNEAIANFADMIREKVNAGDWQGLGELLGNKVNEIVDSIDFAGLGAKVGTGINAWFTTKYWTLQTINFQNIGAKIAEFLNNAIEQINFNTIGRTITQKFTIIGDFLIGALENINWSLIGQSIGDFVRGAFDQVSEWLQGIDWSTVGTEFYNALKNTLIGIDFSSVAQSVFTFLGSALGAASSFIISAIQQAWADIKAYFLQYIPDDASWAEAGLGILKGIASAFVGLFQWVYNNIYTPFVNSFKSVFGISSGNATQMESSGEKIGWGIIDGIVAPFANPVGWILEKIVNKIKEGLEKAWGGTTVDENGFSGTSGTIPVSTTIDEDSFSGTSGKIPIDIEITGVVDNIPDVDKVSKDWGIYVEDWTDGIPNSNKTSNNWSANMTKATDNVPVGQKTIPSIAKFLEIQKSFSGSNVTAAGNPIFDARARFVGQQQGLFKGNYATAAGNPVFDSRARFVAQTQGLFKGNYATSGGNPIFDARARFVAQTQGLFKGNYATSGGNPIFDSRARFVAQQQGLFKGSQATSSGNPLFASRADFVAWNQNFPGYMTTQYGNPIFSSLADFTNYSDGFYSQPSLDAKANFVDYSDGLYNRPTIDVEARVSNIYSDDYNLKYNAGGGVYSGGSWHDIARYAGGGLARGSQLFWARETGSPELVGTLGGHTAVVNNDQIVSSVSAGVSAGVARTLSGFRLKMTGISNTPSIEGGMDEESIYRAMLRALNDSDVFPDEIDLDGATVYRKMVQRNKIERARTGVNPMMAS